MRLFSRKFLYFASFMAVNGPNSTSYGNIMFTLSKRADDGIVAEAVRLIIESNKETFGYATPKIVIQSLQLLNVKTTWGYRGKS